MSSPSWTSEHGTDGRSTPERFQASPSPSPSAPSSPLEWSSDPEDHVPLAQRRAAGRAPTGRRPAAVRKVPSRRSRTEAGTSSRVGAESPDGAASTVTGQDLANIRARYQIPRDVELFLPTPDDRVTSTRPGRIAMYEVCLRVGLRPPFPSFFTNLLDYYSLTPSQLVPNSLRVICAFVILCHHLHISPRISLFRAFYILRAQKGWWLFQPRPGRVLKLLLPSSVKGWKSRFFFASLDLVKSQWGDPDLRGNMNSTVLPGDKEALGQLLTTDIPRYNLLLSEDNLRHAGLTSHSAMKVSTLALKRAAAKKRAREGPSEGEQPPTRRRQVAQVSELVAPAPPTAPEVDLTADTPPEAAVAEGEAATEPNTEGQAMTDEHLPLNPTTAESPRHWGEGPSGATVPPLERVSVPSPTQAEPEVAEDAGERGGRPGPGRDSVLNDGKWAERLISSIIVPEVQEELSHLKAATFFRESYAALIKVGNLAILRLVFFFLLCILSWTCFPDC